MKRKRFRVEQIAYTGEHGDAGRAVDGKRRSARGAGTAREVAEKAADDLRGYPRSAGNGQPYTTSFIQWIGDLVIALCSSIVTAGAALALEQYYIRRGAWDFTSAGYWHVRSKGMWELSIASYPGFRACTQYYADMPADELDFYRENVRTRESIPGWIRNPPVAEPAPSPSGSAIHWMNDVVYGWPFPALRGYGSNVLPNSSWIPRDRPPGPAIARPCRAWLPYWPGFVANTAVAMVASGFCLTGWRWRRRRVRRRTGRCLSCGYPVAGLPRCPECGMSLLQLAPDRAVQTIP